MAIIKAVCISEKKGTAKINVGQAEIIEDFGLKDDAHAGNWHRQVSLLSYEKIEEFKALGVEVKDGDFGENLIVEGIDLRTLPIGTKLKIKDILLEVTQIGKECHTGCAIAQAVGKCIMPTEGIFAKVLKGGTVKIGDEVILDPLCS
ncbi:MAG: MOSC domain-containing protein [Firmicutes bacterium]|nr:MOSC domain-containing protein [Bacillota bacterium]